MTYFEDGVKRAAFAMPIIFNFVRPFDALSMLPTPTQTTAPPSKCGFFCRCLTSSGPPPQTALLFNLETEKKEQRQMDFGSREYPEPHRRILDIPMFFSSRPPSVPSVFRGNNSAPRGRLHARGGRLAVTVRF